MKRYIWKHSATYLIILQNITLARSVSDTMSIRLDEKEVAIN